MSILYFTITAVFFGRAVGSESLQALKARIESLIEGQDAVYGVAFRDLGSGETLFVNGGDRMHAASTMKVPVLMRIFEMLEKNQLSLDTEIEIRNQFKSIVDGSLFSITVDSDEDLYGYEGQARSVAQLLEAMIARSSNLATNILIQIADAAAVNKLMERLGVDGIKVLRGVEDIKAFDLGMNNECSAAAMLQVLTALVDPANFQLQSIEKMIGILRLQEFNDIIPAGIPEGSGALVAHKTGSISTVQHDAAIVDLPGGKRYVLVVFARDFGDEREKVKATGRAVSRAVYDHISGALP